MSPLAVQIEALLFATAESWSVAALAKRLNTTDEAIVIAVDELAQALTEHAFGIVRQGTEVVLATAPDHSELLAAVRKEELSKDLSKASAEVLAIIAYHTGATKAEIEFIRGVNSSYSLRALQIRGLIEPLAKGYAPTLALLEHYGIASVEELPQYAETKQKIATLLAREL
jgi:segregation and condensation protein B